MQKLSCTMITEFTDLSVVIDPCTGSSTTLKAAASLIDIVTVRGNRNL